MEDKGVLVEQAESYIKEVIKLCLYINLETVLNLDINNE